MPQNDLVNIETRDGVRWLWLNRPKLGNAFDGLAAVTTHAVLDAMPAARPARFPVIVFSHGYTGLPSSHTGLFEDLASHGWAVLSVVHPYEATGSMLAARRAYAS